MPTPTRVLCAGVVVLDRQGPEPRILVVQRGRPPSEGRWSIPGGRVESGETLEQAAAREAWEETGLHVEVGSQVGEIDLPGRVVDEVYAVTDFVATVELGSGDELPAPRPGDDAADVRWVTRTELHALPTSPGLVDTLESWGVWD